MTDEDIQASEWRALYGLVSGLLALHGKDDAFGNGDYFLVDDNYGSRRMTIDVHVLAMLRPDIVASLRNLLGSVPDWEIVMAVHVPGTKGKWPIMGLTIRRHEIIDGLQRHLFEEPYRSYRYPDSRVGTGFE